MDELEESWPDADRRVDALERLQARIDVGNPYQRRNWEAQGLTLPEVRVLDAAAHGLGMRETADALGMPYESVREYRKIARRVLRAKNTTHACAEALRLGLIS